MNMVRQKLVDRGLLVPTAEVPVKREHSNSAALVARKLEDPKVRRAVAILEATTKRSQRHMVGTVKEGQAKRRAK